MKNLLTLLVLCGSIGAVFAQNNSIEVYPWNPDANNDNAIGATDIISTLAVYGNEFGTPPEPCTYDGTPLEEFAIALGDGSIVMDSIWFEFELVDIQTYFVLGCPEPVTDTLTFVNYAMLDSPGCICNCGNPVIWSFKGFDAFGEGISIQLHFDSSSGQFWWLFHQDSIYSIEDGFFSGNACSYTSKAPLPWPSDWNMDDGGIHIESGWSSSDWPYYANYMHILPYWHYVE